MLACVDVAYHDHATVGACVLFQTWTASCAASETLISLGPAAPYHPGEFYVRELPPILAVLSQVTVPIEAIIVDGYVWLSSSRVGLGARLHSALKGKVAVVGVAKSMWSSDADAKSTDNPAHRVIAVVRGRSKRPLYVTAAGMDVALAASCIEKMHGPFRIPTILAAADRLARSAVSRISRGSP